MAGRTIAIGDIHGCSEILAALIEAIRPGTEDTVVALGDFIDRGPDSRGVLDRLIELAGRCRFVPLQGNHEELLLDALNDLGNLGKWLTLGGADTLRSYGWIPGIARSRLTDWIPKSHRTFLRSCRPYYETQTHVFVHAGYVPELPMEAQSGLALRWRTTDAGTVRPHCSGKTAIVGHTPQISGQVLDLKFLVCIDTNCWRGGPLTALDTTTRTIWQVDRSKRLSTSRLDAGRQPANGP
jgi:serine/threonine protein phosphatase 1